MRRCKTCKGLLIIGYLTMGLPWQKRVMSFRIAEDCTDLLTARAEKKIEEEVEDDCIF